MAERGLDDGGLRIIFKALLASFLLRSSGLSKGISRIETELFLAMLVRSLRRGWMS